MGYIPELVFFVCERFNLILQTFVDGMFAS